MIQKNEVVLSTSPAQSSEETNSTLPLIPREVEALNLNPRTSHAIPSFIHVEEVSTEQVIALFEKLELPLDGEALEQIERILRKSISELTPAAFVAAQADGWPTSVLFVQQFRVGKDKYSEVRAVNISPDDLSGPYSHISLKLDTHHAEEDTFNVTIDFNIDQIYAGGLQQTVWEELNSLLNLIRGEPLPNSLDKAERVCAEDNYGRLCLTAMIDPFLTLGMLPREKSRSNDDTPLKEEPQPTITESVLERMPQVVFINQPDIAGLRIITRELNRGERSELSLTDEAEGDASFLSNALRLLDEDPDADLNAWSMINFKERLAIAVNRPFKIGNHEFNMAIDFGEASGENTDVQPEIDGDDQDCSVDDAEDEFDPSFGPIMQISPPDITISPFSDECDVSISLAKNDSLFTDDQDPDHEPKVIAALSFGPSVTREQRWALIDRLSLFFDGLKMTSDPDLYQLPADTYNYANERVGIQLSR